MERIIVHKIRCARRCTWMSLFVLCVLLLAGCHSVERGRSDATPATMTYEGQQLTVSVDSEHQVLMVTASDPTPFRTWMQENPVFSSAHIHPDCLHHLFLLFYTRQLHDNAVRRAYGR